MGEEAYARCLGSDTEGSRQFLRVINEYPLNIRSRRLFFFSSLPLSFPHTLLLFPADHIVPHPVPWSAGQVIVHRNIFLIIICMIRHRHNINLPPRPTSPYRTIPTWWLTSCSEFLPVRTHQIPSFYKYLHGDKQVSSKYSLLRNPHTPLLFPFSDLLKRQSTSAGQDPLTSDLLCFSLAEWSSNIQIGNLH